MVKASSYAPSGISYFTSGVATATAKIPHVIEVNRNSRRYPLHQESLVLLEVTRVRIPGWVTCFIASGSNLISESD